MRIPQSTDKFNRLTSDDIRHLYDIEGLNTIRIAELYGISNAIVCRKMTSLGIAARSHKGRMKLVSKEELDALYWDKGLSMSRIASLYHVKNSSVRDHMNLFDIPRRGKGNPGSKNPAWKGGVSFTDNSYVFVYLPHDSPFSSMRSRKSYIAKHRLVMAKHLGRPLKPWEVVHHINGKKMDNRLENLELLPRTVEHLPYIQLQHRVSELEKQVRLLKFEIKMLHNKKIEPICEEHYAYPR